MARIYNTLSFEQDLNQPVRVRQIGGSLYEFSKGALKLECRLFENGAAAAPTGSVICVALTADGVTRTQLNGNISGNVVSIVLPQAFFYPGLITIVMYVVDSNDTWQTPVLALSGVCTRVSSDAFVDSGNVIPSLSSYTSLVSSINSAAETITNGLSTSAELVTANSDRYKCIVTLGS